MSASDLSALLRFAGLALRQSRQDYGAGDWDGSDVEEAMESCGLLKRFKVETPCDDEHCVCEPGDYCFRLTDLAQRALAAAEVRP